MDEKTRQRHIQQHLDAIRDLQAAPAEPSSATWPPQGYYLLWHVLIGMMLGFIGAGVSLLFNVAGAPLAGENPLQLVRVYLTFPMGETALTDPSGKVLTMGCILYLLTGGVYGIAFHIAMTTWLAGSTKIKRFIVGSAIGLGLWIVNFYLILSWLQPMLLFEFWGKFDAATHDA